MNTPQDYLNTLEGFPENQSLLDRDNLCKLLEGYWEWKSVEKIPVMIECPECNTVQGAVVERTLPWCTFIHECNTCKHTIMESEWQEVPPYKTK